MSKVVSSLIRLVFLSFLVVFIYFSERLKITFEYPYYELFDNIYVRLAKASLLLLLLIEVLRLFYYGVIKNQKAPKWLANGATLLIPMIMLLVVLEIAFMFVSQSHEGGLTLASHIWFERYWPPVNSLGYRDAEHVDTTGKKKIIVVGDSYTAGHGLKQVEERYSNILAKGLGNRQYVVYNLGVSGSDTRDEYRRFEKFGVKPDAVVLQYFPNDIEKVAREKGVTPAAFQPYSDLPGRLRVLFQKSYLLNYIYWQLPHGSGATPFEDYARKVYTDPAILGAHLSDLNQFVTYCRTNSIPLYVVLFPFSHNLEKTTQYTRPVVEFFQKNQVPVLLVSSLVKDIDPADRIVGRNDFHASAVVNQRVGEQLSRMMTSRFTKSQQ
ncbi:SGNH/GDSL hydrolase family protein [Larkinella soli]|uniref:SGNH/GDSL hydrolase family protein n=1 Tax=Larkinella soli TaxID=1770527 RepID=UPI000FFCBD99|nr:SGNH/GDSL hydrolase family protein [Larkinella soli]